MEEEWPSYHWAAVYAVKFTSKVCQGGRFHTPRIWNKMKHENTCGTAKKKVSLKITSFQTHSEQSGNTNKESPWIYSKEITEQVHRAKCRRVFIKMFIPVKKCNQSKCLKKGTVVKFYLK